MKNVSLIKKIEYDKSLEEIFPVTFDIGLCFDREKLKEIFNDIKDKDLIAKNGISLGRNSFTVQIKLKDIPQICEILSQDGLSYYGIYVLYDNYLEMKEVEENE